MNITMEEEIWKDIPGYEGCYQASTCGRIRSFMRSSRRKGDFYILSQARSNIGYMCVVLKAYHKQKTCKVHRLVALTFI